MMKIILLLFFLLFANCKFDKVVDHHGVNFLNKKQEKLIVNKSNKNDIFDLLGPPSTKRSFNNDLLIYIETKRSRTTLLKLGKKKIFVNKVFALFRQPLYTQTDILKTRLLQHSCLVFSNIGLHISLAIKTKFLI